jgi:hypothetical protein
VNRWFTSHRLRVNIEPKGNGYKQRLQGSFGKREHPQRSSWLTQPCTIVGINSLPPNTDSCLIYGVISVELFLARIPNSLLPGTDGTCGRRLNQAKSVWPPPFTWLFVAHNFAASLAAPGIHYWNGRQGLVHLELWWAGRRALHVAHKTCQSFPNCSLHAMYCTH